MKTIRNVVIFLIGVAATAAQATDLEVIATIGAPVEGRNEAWQGHVNFVTWLDADTLAYAGESGFVKCYNLSNRSERWSRVMGVKIRQFTSGSGRPLLLDQDGSVHVLAGATGENVRRLDGNTIATLVGTDFLVPNNLAWVPGRNAVLVSTFSKGYGENSFLLDGRSFDLVGRVTSDGFLTDISPTRDGSNIVALSLTDNIRIWSVDQMREVFKMGEDRIRGVDVPFLSNAMFDGRKTLVYSVDNSWATGTVHVYDIQRKNDDANFDSRNGHLEMDVDFTTSRVALTGTSRKLTLVDFSGRVLAERKNVASQRVVAVSFSPDGKRLALGSWDNTVRVFEIREERTPTRPSMAIE